MCLTFHDGDYFVNTSLFLRTYCCFGTNVNLFLFFICLFFFRGPKYDPELGHVYPVQLKQITKIESFLMMGPWALQGLY